MKIGNNEYKKINLEKELSVKRYDYCLSIIQSANAGEGSLEEAFLRSGAYVKLLACLIYKEDKKFSEKEYFEILNEIEDAPLQDILDAREEVVKSFLGFIKKSRKGSQKSTKKKK